LVSFDATSWDVISNSPPVEKYLNRLFLGYPNPLYLVTSPDAYAWTTNSFVPNHAIDDIAFGDGTFIALALNLTNGFRGEIWQSDPIAESPPRAPSLDIGTYPGLTIAGSPGKPVRIEYSESMPPNATWQTLTNTILPTSPWLFIDTQSAIRQRRFYRAVAE
jgi:hypothetical protein